MKSQNNQKTLFARKILAFLLVFGILLSTCAVKNTASAASGYLIKINKQANCVTIYKKNTKGSYQAVKAMICSTGYATKLGTYSLGEKMRWHTLDGPCYGQYCTRIYGGVLFHSVWYTGYNNPSTLSVTSYNKLGTTASHGCIRLTVQDAKWIYDNVPSGTQVVIYSDSNPGPLGKPTAIKVPYSCRWDPTDTGNPNNPWNSKKPSITGVKSQTVEYGGKYDVMKGVTAKNTTGFDAKSLLKITITYGGKKVSKVDTKKPGSYKVKYSLVDEIGRKASASATIKVTAPLKKPVIQGAKKLYVTSKKKLTKSYLLKQVTIKQGGKKLASKYVKVQVKKIKNTKKNAYTITYTAQHSSLPAVVKTKAYIDTKAPKISGVTNGKTYTVDVSQKINKAYARSLIKKVSDNYTKLKKSNVAVSVTKLKQGAKYKLAYKVKDSAGNKRKVKIYVKKVNCVTIPSVADQNIEIVLTGDETNIESTIKAKIKERIQSLAIQGTSSLESEKNTAKITKIALQEDGTYLVTVKVTDSKKHTQTAEIKVTISVLTQEGATNFEE